MFTKYTLLLVLLFFISCRGTQPAKETPKEPETPKAITTPEPNPPAAVAPQPDQTPVQNAIPPSSPPHVETTTQKPPPHHSTAEGTPPSVALRWLKNGNTRFVKGFFRNDGASQKDVQRLASGQKPHSAILSCSDSRVPPEVIFDQKLGEIFTVRSAGEAIEPTTIGSLEYAIEHLGVKNLVVLGHTNCGAVKAAFSTLDGQDAGSENLNKLVKDIHPRIEKYKGQTPTANYVDESWSNVEGVVRDLLSRSKIILEHVKSGDLEINTGLYDLATGRVQFR